MNKYIPLTKELFEAGNEFICKKDEEDSHPNTFQFINSRIDKYIGGHKRVELTDVAHLHVDSVTEEGITGWIPVLNRYYDYEFQFSDFLAIVEEN